MQETDKISRQESREAVENSQKISRRQFLEKAATGIVGVLGGVTIKEIIDKGGNETQLEPVIENYVQLIDSEEALDSTTATQIRTQLQYLAEQFSPSAIGLLKKDHESAVASREQTPGTTIHNRTGAAGISEKFLEHLWVNGDTYPAAWVAQVSEINFVAEQKSMADVGLAGSAAATMDRSNDIMTFYDARLSRETSQQSEAVSKLISKWDETFSHELGHANDWIGNDQLSARQRLEMLYTVTRHYVSRHETEHNLDWSYPDRLTQENVYDERLAKVTEWWAELCTDYFQNPADLQSIRPDLYRLVHTFVQRSDRTFDPFRAADKRRAVLKLPPAEKPAP